MQKKKYISNYAELKFMGPMWHVLVAPNLPGYALWQTDQFSDTDEWPFLFQDDGFAGWNVCISHLLH